MATQAVVYVVDDDPSVRRALARLIRTAGYQVVALASSQAFLEYPHSTLPSCLVLDVRLPGLSGLELQERLSATARRMPIIFITGHGTVPMSVRAMKAGALDFLQKPFEDRQLLAAVDQAIRRDREATRESRTLESVHERYESLTPREREVLELVVSGCLNKQVAAKLGTSEKTIKVHRARVMHKMQASSLPDLVRMAEKLGVFPRTEPRE